MCIEYCLAVCWLVSSLGVSVCLSYDPTVDVFWLGWASLPWVLLPSFSILATLIFSTLCENTQLSPLSYLTLTTLSTFSWALHYEFQFVVEITFTQAGCSLRARLDFFRSPRQLKPAFYVLCYLASLFNVGCLLVDHNLSFNSCDFSIVVEKPLISF